MCSFCYGARLPYVCWNHRLPVATHQCLSSLLLLLLENESLSIIPTCHYHCCAKEMTSGLSANWINFTHPWRLLVSCILLSTASKQSGECVCVCSTYAPLGCLWNRWTRCLNVSMTVRSTLHCCPRRPVQISAIMQKWLHQTVNAKPANAFQNSVSIF